MKPTKNIFFLCLLALNIVAFAFLGCKYLYSVAKERQEQQKHIVAAANIFVKMGTMNITDATRLMELSNNLEHGAKISDQDLDWCLDQLKGQKPSYASALSRREDVDLTLSESVKVLTSAQKEKLSQAMLAELAVADPKEEIGVDVLGPAHILGKLGDRRAIPMIEVYRNDSRPLVHKVVLKALDRLEGKAT